MDTPQSSRIFEKANETVDFLRNILPSALHHPSTAVICGSGLGTLADAVRHDLRVEVSYGEIPHFPQSTVQGHAGKLLFGFLGMDHRPVVLMVGRAHFYEGHSISDITFPIRVLKLLGVEILVVTNAAGGLNSDYAIGDLVVLNDHLNLAGLAGVHPLRGPNVVELGVRFPPLSDAYDLDLRRSAHRAWDNINKTKQDRRLHEGVYAFVGGPSYETRAECRMLHMLGADLVGMSTVPEIIVARHSGIRVLAVSLVTNNAVLEAGPSGDDTVIADASAEVLTKTIQKGMASHEEVLEAGRSAAQDMQSLICSFIESL